VAYLGSKPSSNFITTAKQRVTSSTNAFVDLDHAISSLADVIVWVNYIKQDATNLSLTTSTRITLGGTLTASDVVEIAYLGKSVATQTPSDNSVTNNMLAGSIDLTSKVTGALPQANIGDQAINEAKMQVSNSPVNGYMLTAQSGNTGGLTWAEAGSGAMTRVGGASGTSNVANVSFSNVFTSTYSNYIIKMAITPATTNTRARFKLLQSGSAIGDNHYHWIAGGRGVSGSSESGVGGGEGNSPSTYYQMTQWGGSNNSGQQQYITLHIQNPLPATTNAEYGDYVMFQQEATVYTSDSYMTRQYGGGMYANGGNNDGILIYQESGDIAKHKIDIYGLQDS